MNRLRESIGLLTNIGVLVGLILLIYEINQTNIAMDRDYRAWNTTAFQSMQQLWVDWSATIADRESADVWWRGVSGEELDPVDQEWFFRTSSGLHQ